MTHLQDLFLWDAAIKTNKGKNDAFADPLERPEWQSLSPLLRAYLYFSRSR